MNSIRIGGGPTCAVLVAGFALASNLSAQEITTSPAAMIFQIEEAGSSLPDRNRWIGLADSLEAKAAEKPAGDPAALEQIRGAALLRLHAGQPRQAFRLMEEAAESAASRGELIIAAHSYIDGAWIASGIGRGDLAREMAERAVLLSASPLMDARDREAIRLRVDGSTSMALIAGD